MCGLAEAFCGDSSQIAFHAPREAPSVEVLHVILTGEPKDVEQAAPIILCELLSEVGGYVFTCRAFIPTAPFVEPLRILPFVFGPRGGLGDEMGRVGFLFVVADVVSEFELRQRCMIGK